MNMSAIKNTNYKKWLGEKRILFSFHEQNAFARHTIEILVDKIFVIMSEPIWHDDAIANRMKSDALRWRAVSSLDQCDFNVNAITHVHSITNEMEQTQTTPSKGK